MVSFSKDKRCSRLFTRLCKNWPGLMGLSFGFLFKGYRSRMPSPFLLLEPQHVSYLDSLEINANTLIVRFSSALL